MKAEIAGVKPPADEAGSSVGGLGKQLLAVGGTVAGLAAVKEGLQKIVDQTIAYERTQKQLEYALADKSAQEFKSSGVKVLDDIANASEKSAERQQKAQVPDTLTGGVFDDAHRLSWQSTRQTGDIGPCLSRITI